MNTMQKKLSGAALAITAAGFLSLAAATAQAAEPVSMAGDAKVQCWGVNACKGQNDCATAENSCKGQGSCKGHGFLNLTRDDCEAKGGTIK